MESTEKKRRGKNVVIGILLLATIGAGLTWINYIAQAPSTKDAHLISDRIVLATFSAHAARNIREGAKAIVTVESSAGKTLSGTVQSLQTKDPKTTAVIFLEETPQNAKPLTPCYVTVDTSLSSEALKAD
jgi:multidrug resistance efflux pump